MGISPRLIDRFKRLPRDSSDVWLGGLVRLFAWIEQGPDGRPYRPWGGFWVSGKSGRVHMKIEPAPGAHGFELALDALVESALKQKLSATRPARLEVTSRAFADYVRHALGDLDLEVAVRDRLPEVDTLLREMAEWKAGPLPPGPLDVPGVTVDRVRAFAAAAERFYQAAPWRHLNNEDLIRVERPRAGKGLEHLVVMGAGGQTFGLAFFESAKRFEAMTGAADPREFLEPVGAWGVYFDPPWKLPFGDLELWEALDLPVAAERAYPAAMRIRPGAEVERPDARTLAYFEGLLRALAETSEAEMDAGQWTREVATFDGPATFVLTLPDLLESERPAERRVTRRRADRRAMERFSAEVERFLAEHEHQFETIEQVNDAVRRRFTGRTVDELPSTARTPLEQAQDLMYEAFDARGRRQIQLARRALELSRDCADAYVLLAERAVEPEEAVRLYAEGVAAGERALGSRVFDEEAGHFWGLVTTRPYMRARCGLAQILEQGGRTDQAIAHYHELLREPERQPGRPPPAGAGAA